MGLNEYTAMEDQDDSYFEDYFGDMNEDDEKANEDSDKLKDFHVGYFLFNDNLKCQNMLDENDLAKHFKKFARPRYDVCISFHAILIQIFTKECPGLCQHRPRNSLGE